MTLAARILMSVVLVLLGAGSFALWQAYAAEPPVIAWDWVSVLWCPVGFALIWVWAEFNARRAGRIIAEKNLTVMPSHRRHNRGALFMFIAVMLLGQAILLALAWHIVGADGRETAGRVFLGFLGAVLIVMGNHRAKLETPYRDGAVEAPAWGRTQRIVGWMMVLTGVVMIPCALLLPLLPVAYALLGYFVAMWLLMLALRLRARRSA